MEKVTGGKRGAGTSENGAGVTPKRTDGTSPKIAELVRMLEQLVAKNPGLRAGREAGDAGPVVREAECRRVRSDGEAVWRSGDVEAVRGSGDGEAVWRSGGGVASRRACGADGRENGRGSRG